MAEPSQRERELAQALDEQLFELEQLGLGFEEHTARIRALLAQALAAYREEIVRGLNGHKSIHAAALPAGNEGG